MTGNPSSWEPFAFRTHYLSLVLDSTLKTNSMGSKAHWFIVILKKVYYGLLEAIIMTLKTLKKAYYDSEGILWLIRSHNNISEDSEEGLLWLWIRYLSHSVLWLESFPVPCWSVLESAVVFVLYVMICVFKRSIKDTLHLGSLAQTVLLCQTFFSTSVEELVHCRAGRRTSHHQRP